MDFGPDEIAPDFDFVPLFKSGRLIFRHIDEHNFERLLLHSNQQAVRLFLGSTNDAVWEEQLRRYKAGLHSWNNTFCHFFLFNPSDSSRAIGYCGFHQMHPGHRKAELGYSLFSDDFKRQGLMTEAVQFVISFGFGQLKLIRIEAMTSPENIASKKILENNGFQLEGHLRQNYLRDGKAEDSLMYSLLNEEELNLMKQNL
jgi:ribosomal-protein-alanine N-acetyltransferase